MTESPYAWRDGLRLAVGTFSVLPVPAPSRVGRSEARVAMLSGPLVGLGLGAVAAVVVVLTGHTHAGSVLGAVLGVAVVAALSRGLHLDGLADVGDGLGSRRYGEDAIRVMKEPAIGALGAVLLVFCLLAQVSALAACLANGSGAGALVVAVVTGRTAITLCCVDGVAAARPDGLGAAVAGVVPRPVAAVVGVTTVLLAVLVGALDRDTPWWSLPLAVVAALAVAAALVRTCRRRFGGITGDVLGAACEVAVTGALVTAALTC